MNKQLCLQIDELESVKCMDSGSLIATGAVVGLGVGTLITMSAYLIFT